MSRNEVIPVLNNIIVAPVTSTIRYHPHLHPCWEQPGDTVTIHLTERHAR